MWPTALNEFDTPGFEIQILVSQINRSCKEKCLSQVKKQRVDNRNLHYEKTAGSSA